MRALHSVLASILLETVLDDILSDFGRFLETFYFDIEALDVGLFGLDLHLNALYHFFEHLDLGLSVFALP